MSIHDVSPLRMSQQRSSSWSEFTMTIVDESPPSNFSSHSPHFHTPIHKNSLQDSTDSQDSYDTLSFDSKVDLRKTYSSNSTFENVNKPFTARLSSENSYEEYMSPTKFPREPEIVDDDDEEIKPRELPPLKESDLEVSINMVTSEMITSSNSPVTYPCHISIKIKEEMLIEQPSLDLLILVDIRDHDMVSFSEMLQVFLTHLNERDRLSFFSTQVQQVKRFPFRVMDEPSKSEFINEFFHLHNLSFNTQTSMPLIGAFNAAVQAIKNRRYKNHVTAVLIITDSADEAEFAGFTDKDLLANEDESPLVYAFGLGQKHNPIVLQEICEYCEGKYQYIENLVHLESNLLAFLQELNYIRVKNVKLSLETGSNECNSETVKIAKVYEKKALLERSTRRFVIQKSYFSIKDGIDLALELELSKCNPGLDIKRNSYFLQLTLTGDSLTQASQLNLTAREELTVKIMHLFLCSMPKSINRKALEDFYRIKMEKKLFQSIKMANSGCIKHSVQCLTNLKKELYSFKMFKSHTISAMLQDLEWFLNNLQRDSFNAKEKFLLIKALNSKFKNEVEIASQKPLLCCPN